MYKRFDLFDGMWTCMNHFQNSPDRVWDEDDREFKEWAYEFNKDLPQRLAYQVPTGNG